MLLAEKKAFAYSGEYTYKKAVPRQTGKPVVERQAVNAKVRYMLSIALVFILGISVLIRYACIVELNYQISKEKKQLDELIKHTETLKIKLSELKSYERIEQIAITRLGMKRPDQNQLVYLGAQITDPVNKLN